MKHSARLAAATAVYDQAVDLKAACVTALCKINLAPPPRPVRMPKPEQRKGK